MRYNSKKQLSDIIWESSVLTKDFWSNSFLTKKKQLFFGVDFLDSLKNGFPVKGSAFWVLEELDWVDYNLQRVKKAINTKTKLFDLKSLANAGFHYKNLTTHKYYTIAAAALDSLLGKQEDIFKKSDSSASSEEVVDLFSIRQFTAQTNLRWLFASNFLNRLLEGDKLHTGVSNWALFFFKTQKNKRYGEEFSKFRQYNYLKEQSKIQTYFYFLSKKNVMFFSNFSKLSLFYRLLTSPLSANLFETTHFSTFGNRVNTKSHLKTAGLLLNPFDLSNGCTHLKWQHGGLSSDIIFNLRYPYYWERNFMHWNYLSGFKKSFPLGVHLKRVFILETSPVIFFNSNSAFIGNSGHDTDFYVSESFFLRKELLMYFNSFMADSFVLSETLSEEILRKLFFFFSNTNSKIYFRQIFNKSVGVNKFINYMLVGATLSYKYKMWASLKFFFFYLKYNNIQRFDLIKTNMPNNDEPSFSLEVSWNPNFMDLNSYFNLWVTNIDRISFMFLFNNNIKLKLFSFLVGFFPFKLALMGEREVALTLDNKIWLFHKINFNWNLRWAFNYEIIEFEWKDNIDDFLIFVKLEEFWDEPLVFEVEGSSLLKFYSFVGRALYSNTPQVTVFTNCIRIFDLYGGVFFTTAFSIFNNMGFTGSELQYKILFGVLNLLTREFNLVTSGAVANTNTATNFFTSAGLSRLADYSKVPTYSKINEFSAFILIFSRIPLFYNWLASIIFTKRDKVLNFSVFSELVSFFHARYLSLNYFSYTGMLRDAIFSLYNKSSLFGSVDSRLLSRFRKDKTILDFTLFPTSIFNLRASPIWSDSAMFWGESDRSFFSLLQSTSWGYSRFNDIYFTSSKNYLGTRTATLPILRGGLSTAHSEFFFFFSNKDRRIYKNYMRSWLSVKNKGKFSSDRKFKILFSENDLFDRISNRLLYDLNFSGGLKRLGSRSHLFQPLRTPLTQSLEKLLFFEFLSFEKDVFFNFFESSLKNFYINCLTETVSETNCLNNVVVITQQFNLFNFDQHFVFQGALYDLKAFFWCDGFWNSEVESFFFLFRI